MSDCYIDEGVRKDVIKKVACGLSFNKEALKHENACVLVLSGGDGAEGGE